MFMTRKPLVCKAFSEKSTNPITVARKTFEQKRSIVLKKNLNNLIQIATADTKELADFAKELDQIHKKLLFEKDSKPESTDLENVFTK